MVLIPVADQDFAGGQGSSTVDVHFSPAAGQYKLADFRLDAELTFQNTQSNKWKFIGPQGQLELAGVFLSPFLTELTSNTGGSGGTVARVAGQSPGCFLELIR